MSHITYKEDTIKWSIDTNTAMEETQCFIQTPWLWGEVNEGGGMRARVWDGGTGYPLPPGNFF